MEELVQGLVSAGLSIYGLIYLLYLPSPSRRLAICPILLYSTSAASSSLYHFTVDSPLVDQDWPKVFSNWFDVCTMVLQVWAIVTRLQLISSIEADEPDSDVASFLSCLGLFINSGVVLTLHFYSLATIWGSSAFLFHWIATASVLSVLRCVCDIGSDRQKVRSERLWTGFFGLAFWVIGNRITYLHQIPHGLADIFFALCSIKYIGDLSGAPSQHTEEPDFP